MRVVITGSDKLHINNKFVRFLRYTYSHAQLDNPYMVIFAYPKQIYKKSTADGRVEWYRSPAAA